jgi:hypothetical protein
MMQSRLTIRDVFREFDLNGDGHLDPSDLARC